MTSLFQYSYVDADGREMLCEVALERLPDGTFHARINGAQYHVAASPIDGGWLLSILSAPENALHAAGDQALIYAASASSRRWVWADGVTFTFDIAERRRGNSEAASPASRAGELVCTAQMPAQVRAVLAMEGDIVERGQSLVVLEAMKMEMRVTAPARGRIKRIVVQVGDLVARGQTLVELKRED